MFGKVHWFSYLDSKYVHSHSGQVVSQTNGDVIQQSKLASYKDNHKNNKEYLSSIFSNRAQMKPTNWVIIDIDQSMYYHNAAQRRKMVTTK